jgi:hypothetical protein
LGELVSKYIKIIKKCRRTLYACPLVTPVVARNEGWWVALGEKRLTRRGYALLVVFCVVC